LFVDMTRRKVANVADRKDAATVEEFADFLEAHGGKREAVPDASIDIGAAFEAGIKENFPNAEITFDNRRHQARQRGGRPGTARARPPMFGAKAQNIGFLVQFHGLARRRRLATALSGLRAGRPLRCVFRLQGAGLC
jgi:hypothetical protein